MDIRSLFLPYLLFVSIFLLNFEELCWGVATLAYMQMEIVLQRGETSWWNPNPDPDAHTKKFVHSKSICTGLRKVLMNKIVRVCGQILKIDFKQY